MAELIPDRPFVQSAFAAEGKYDDMTRVGDFAAVAGFVPNRVIRKAIITAVSLSQGQDVPGRVELAGRVPRLGRKRDHASVADLLQEQSGREKEALIATEQPARSACG